MFILHEDEGEPLRVIVGYSDFFDSATWTFVKKQNMAARVSRKYLFMTQYKMKLAEKFKACIKFVTSRMTPERALSTLARLKENLSISDGDTNTRNITTIDTRVAVTLFRAVSV